MIDNQNEVRTLIQKMKAHLPIPAHPGRELIQALRGHGITLKPAQRLEIVDVLYMGDEGGIACAIKGTGDEKVATISSLTHLVVPAEHPLAEEIRAYQRERTFKLSGMGQGQPGSFTVKPKNKKKKKKR